MHNWAKDFFLAENGQRANINHCDSSWPLLMTCKPSESFHLKVKKLNTFQRQSIFSGWKILKLLKFNIKIFDWGKSSIKRRFWCQLSAVPAHLPSFFHSLPSFPPFSLPPFSSCIEYIVCPACVEHFSRCQEINLVLILVLVEITITDHA